MTALMIIGAILIFFFAIGMTRLRFRLAYRDDIVAVVQVLFIKFRIYPKKRRKYKSGAFRIKRFRRRVKRNLKRADSREARKRLRAEKKKNKKQSDSDAANGNGGKRKRAIKPLVRMLLRIFKVFIQRFPRYLQITVSRLIIGVGTDDAAATAVTYGYVVQSVQYLITYIKQNSNLKRTKKAVVSVYPDFAAVKSTVELDVTLNIRVWQVIALGISLVIAYLNKGNNQKNKAS